MCNEGYNDTSSRYSGNAATLFYEADLFIKSNLKQFDFDNGNSDKLVIRHCNRASRHTRRPAPTTCAYRRRSLMKRSTDQTRPCWKCLRR